MFWWPVSRGNPEVLGIGRILRRDRYRQMEPRSGVHDALIFKSSATPSPQNKTTGLPAAGTNLGIGGFAGPAPG